MIEITKISISIMGKSYSTKRKKGKPMEIPVSKVKAKSRRIFKVVKHLIEVPTSPTIKMKWLKWWRKSLKDNATSKSKSTNSNISGIKIKVSAMSTKTKNNPSSIQGQKDESSLPWKIHGIISSRQEKWETSEGRLQIWETFLNLSQLKKVYWKSHHRKNR